MDEEYTLKNGINYRNDGFAFCDRCGHLPIVKDQCLTCDVQVTSENEALAQKIKDYCFRRSSGPVAGCYDGRPESFDVKLAAKIIAAWNK